MENNTAEKFYQYYKSFLQDIMVAFPEFKEQIIERHASLLRVNYPQSAKKRGKCDRWRKTVFKFMVDNGTMISDKDPKIFILPECKNCLARDIDFEKIWNSSISQTSREQLWNYLQTFYMLAVSETTNNDLGTLFKNFESVLENKDSKRRDELLIKRAKMFGIHYDVANFSNLREKKKYHTKIIKQIKSKYKQILEKYINIVKTQKKYKHIRDSELYLKILEKLKHFIDNPEHYTSIKCEDEFQPTPLLEPPLVLET